MKKIVALCLVCINASAQIGAGSNQERRLDLPPVSSQAAGLATFAPLATNGISDWAVSSRSGGTAGIATPPVEIFVGISRREFSALEEKATHGDIKAQYELAARYAQGISVKKDSAKSSAWLKKAAENGDPRAERRMGESLLGMIRGPEDAGPALVWLRKAADGGDVEAEFNLGVLYSTVPKNDTEAFKWFLQAAQQGMAEAQNSVGTAYDQGKGVGKDSEVAHDWFEKAAAQDNPDAMNNLGVLYFNGRGVPQDTKEGVRWWVKSAFHGDWDAQVSLGTCYATGNGVPQDTKEAESLLEGAAVLGDAAAADKLGNLFISTEPDYEKARAWFSKAAAAGLAPAESDLGLALHRGMGGSNDDVEAMKWFNLSAGQGYETGRIYTNILSASLDPSQTQEARRRADAFKPQISLGGIALDSKSLVCPMGDELQIPVQMFGMTKHLIVDTGSDSICLDQKDEARLGDPSASDVMITALAPGTKTSIYRCPEITIADKQFTPSWTACGNFKMVASASADPVDGLLGMDFLKNYVFCLDAGNNTFSLDGSVSEATKKSALAIPIKKIPSGVYGFGIDATVNGSESICFVIDSGAGGSVYLSTEDWQRAFPSEPTNLYTVPVGGVEGGLAPAKAARLPALQVGTNTYTNLIVVCVPGLPSRLASGFIRRHVLTLDFPNETLYLQPGKLFAEADNLNRSGMELVRRDERTLVFSVDKASPAFRAGIKPNDEIISINGLRAASVKLEAINKTLNTKSGDKVTIAIKRNGKDLTFKFPL